MHALHTWKAGDDIYIPASDSIRNVPIEHIYGFAFSFITAIQNQSKTTVHNFAPEV